MKTNMDENGNSASLCPKYRRYLQTAKSNNKNQRRKDVESPRLVFPTQSNNTECSFARRLRDHYGDRDLYDYGSSLRVSTSGTFSGEDGTETPALSETKANFDAARSWGQKKKPAMDLVKGIRQLTLEKYLLDLNRRQLMKEPPSSDCADQMNFDTEYSANFATESKPDRKNNRQSTMQTFYHPLHGRNPLVFFGNNKCMNGKVAYKSFRKSCDFSKPISERMDTGWNL